jgi:acyl carrier protein
MVPAIWVEMENFPVTASGKVDKKELPNPDVSELVSDRYVAPRNEMEQKLAKIWQHLLELEEVGIYDNFFQLGGHSLLAIRLISSIRKELEVEVEIGEVFDYPTIFDLSAHLEGMREGVSLPPIEKSKRPDYIPLSFSQERLWFLDQLEGSRHYHVPAVLRLKGDLSKEALQYAMQTIVNRHEVLRSVITEKEGQGYQHVLDQATWHIEIIDDNNLKNDSAALVRFAEVSIGKPFNLAKDHMLRAHLIVLGPQEYILVATMHHIASDGWSLSILVKELVELYSAYTQNRPPNVVPLELQYADYAIWQRQHLEGKLESRLEYWKHKLEGVTPLQLPVDYARPLVQGNKGDVVNFTIEKDLSNGLQKLSHQQGSTMFMTLLAAFKVLLYKYSGQSDICVGTPIANRTQQELEGLIGLLYKYACFKN